MNTPLVPQIHASLTKADRDESEEGLMCQYCGPLATTAAWHSWGGLIRRDHHPSMMSFKASSDRCPLCQQLRKWIGEDTLTKCEISESHGCRITIGLIGLEEIAVDEQGFRGIRDWIFSLDDVGEFAMINKIWRKTGETNFTVRLTVAHDGGEFSNA